MDRFVFRHFGSLGAMFGSALLLLVCSVIPRVENPWPETIGVGFPIAMAGTWGVLAGVINLRSPPDRRDRAIGGASFYGFCFGGAVYALALLIQIGSHL